MKCSLLTIKFFHIWMSWSTFLRETSVPNANSDNKDVIIIKIRYYNNTHRLRTCVAGNMTLSKYDSPFLSFLELGAEVCREICKPKVNGVCNETAVPVAVVTEVG